MRTWKEVPPAAVDLDVARLSEFRDWVESPAGIVVRHGSVAYSWGTIEQPEDISSAAKPVFVHFLLAAAEAGLISSLDEPVSRVIPELAELNPERGYPDRGITWRHLADQTSGYGVAEGPGQSYNYSDYAMALLWDALFRGLYGATPETVDALVGGPVLFDRIGCEDAPSFNFHPRIRGRLGISARDLARFGLMYLNGGRWGFARLLPEEVVSAAVSSPMPGSVPRTRGHMLPMLPRQRSIGSGHDFEELAGIYGFAWWVNGYDAAGRRHWPNAPQQTFAAVGHGSQNVLVVMPELDLVAVWVTGFARHVPDFVSRDGRNLLDRAFGLLAAAALDAGYPAPDPLPHVSLDPPPPARDPGVWSEPELVAPEGRMANLILEASGRMHAVFIVGGSEEGDVPGKLFYRRRNAGMRDWTTAEPVVGGDRATEVMSAADASGNLHVAWSDGKRVFYNRRGKLTGWTLPVPLPGMEPMYHRYPDLVTGPDGAVWISSLYHRLHFSGKAAFFRLNLAPLEIFGSLTCIGMYGGAVRHPAAIGFSAGITGDPGRAVAVLGGARVLATPLFDNGRRGPMIDLMRLPLGKGLPGVRAVFADEDIVAAVAWWFPLEYEPRIVANSGLRARAGRPAVIVGASPDVPRIARAKDTGRIFVLYGRNGLARLTAWHPENDAPDSLGFVSPNVPEQVAENQSVDYNRRIDVGAVAAENDGAAHVLYYENEALYLRTWRAIP